jgi:hypothetical protein
MKKNIGLLAILVLLLPCLGFSDAVSFRLGYFVPQAKSDLWDIEFENMTFTKSNFQNTTLGFTYEHFLTREISLVVGFESYSKMQLGDYRDYVGYAFVEGDFAFPSDYEGDFLISHQFSVSITPIHASLKLTPLGRKSGFIPYIGGGVSMYIWSVKLQGGMIDFTDAWTYDDPDHGPIDVYGITQENAREETRFAFGFQAFAGFMIPFASRVAFEAELRYNYGKGNFKDSFKGFEKFDLSGFLISLGINYRF